MADNADPPATGGSLNAAVGAAVRARRRELGLTQTDVADAMAVTLRHYQRLEAGRAAPITPNQLLVIARRLRIPAWRLVQRAEQLLAEQDNATPD